MYLNEKIGEDLKKQIINGKKFIFIDAPTGSGKTQLILRMLRPWIREQGKSMLILVSRAILEEQMEEELYDSIFEDLDTANAALDQVTTMTYHRCAELVKRKQMVEYDMVICDECHFFITDSTYAIGAAQISYNWVVNQKQATKIFLSGTMDSFHAFINNDRELVYDHMLSMRKATIISNGANSAIRFHERSDYSSLRTKYLNSNEEIITLCEQNKGKKSIIFTSSLYTGENLLEELKEKNIKAFFLTSQNRDSEEGGKVVKTLAEKGFFPLDVLIATAVLDVGVSIKDRNLNQIFIRSYNQEEFLQMIGRVRVPQEKGYEGITLYINKIKQQYVDRRLDSERDIINTIELARKKDDLALAFANGELSRDKCPFLYFTADSVEISNLAVYRHRELFKKYKEVSEGLAVDPDFFLMKQLGWLGLEESYSIQNYVGKEVREEIKKEVAESLEKIYLEYGDKELSGKDEKIKLLAKIKPYVRKLNSQYVRSNNTLSDKKFNEFCEEEGFPYYIEIIHTDPTRYILKKQD